MMGIKVPETCCANNKICNKNSSVASSWNFISTDNFDICDGARDILENKRLDILF
jgi:hypothetical protein